MLETLCSIIEKEKLNIYTLTQISERDIVTVHIQPSNSCNNSYSVAKAFTMTAIGMLRDEGLLDVRDPVFPIFRDSFPAGYDKTWEEVTIENVIKHQVGFDSGFLDIDVENIYEYGTDDFLSVVLSRSLPFKPGTHWVYSDASYYLLSRIVSVKTGMKLDDYLQSRLFTPLRFQEVAWSKCPKGYPMGATGLYIRTEDMAKLGWVYLNGGMFDGKRIVSEAWVKQVLSGGYELCRMDGNNAYAKGGMNGQLLYISFSAKKVIAWHGYCPNGTGTLESCLTLFAD